MLFILFVIISSLGLIVAGAICRGLAGLILILLASVLPITWFFFAGMAPDPRKCFVEEFQVTPTDDITHLETIPYVSMNGNFLTFETTLSRYQQLIHQKFPKEKIGDSEFISTDFQEMPLDDLKEHLHGFILPASWPKSFSAHSFYLRNGFDDDAETVSFYDPATGKSYNIIWYASWW